MAGAIGIDRDRLWTEMSRARKRGDQIVLFLGAGCSTGEVPLARDIVHQLRARQGAKVLPYEVVIYATEVAEHIPDEGDRLKHFQRVCINAAPTKAHRWLAEVLADWQLDNPGTPTPLVLTTNFDSLIERALVNAGANVGVVDVQGRDCSTAAGLASILQDAVATKDVVVVKLFGDAVRGTVTLDLHNGRDVAAALGTVLPGPNQMVVIGYAGAEAGVAELMAELREQQTLDPRQLYWSTPFGVIAPFENEYNYVFAEFLEEQTKWVKNLDFATAVGTLVDPLT